MKKIILSVFISLLTIAAFSQGSVTFQNASTVAGWNPVMDRNVKVNLNYYYYTNIGGFYSNYTVSGNLSSNYAGLNLTGLRAALYYAPGTVADAAWQTVNLAATGGSAATFRETLI
jgi:hypothetical protein